MDLAQADFNYLSVGEEILEVKENIHSSLVKQTGELRDCFYSLVKGLQASIMKDYKLGTVKEVLRFYDKKIFENLQSCRSIKEFFWVLQKKFCKFFDYDVIKMLCNTFGCQKRLMEYKLKFHEYCKSRLCEIPLDDEKLYVLIIDKSVSGEDLQKLQYTMNRVLGHSSLPLMHFGSGQTFGASSVRTKAKKLMSRIGMYV